MKYYDLIVVGAGIAGCTLAKKMAEAGFDVALVDKNARKKIGHPWEVAIENNTFRQLLQENTEEYLKEEEPLFYRFYADNPSYYIQMDSRKAFVIYIQHRKLNQLLLESILKRADSFPGKLDFFSRCEVHEPILRNDCVCGVRGVLKSLRPIPRKFTFMARTVADASGLSRVLCRQMPEEFLIEKKMASGDCVSAYQEVREIKPEQLAQFKEHCGFEPGIHYTSIGLHKAYQVIHLRKNNTANLIFGAALDSASASGYALCNDFLNNNPYFGEKISGGGNLIPIRHAIGTMVGNGFLSLGDASCQVVPVMGSGVSSGAHAAMLAANVLTAALKENNLSKERLWEYNYQYQSRRGAILASYDIIRRYLQSAPIEELRQIFKAGFLGDENFSQIYTSRKIIYNLNQVLSDLKKILTDLNLLPLSMKMLNLLNQSEKIFHLFQHYSKVFQKDEFLSWQKKVDKIFSQYKV
jgi:flavin-dependent dehydrogenase